jgi:copper transport protein
VRLATRAAAAAAAIVAIVLLGAIPAAAHAVVVTSSPNDGARLSAPPAEVQIRFSEPVSIELGGLRVVDRNGDRVDVGATNAPQPTVIAIALEPDLRAGAYIASYRVVSADGHPISGAITFAVGDSTESITSGAMSPDDDALEVIGWGARLATYLGALTASGLAFYLTYLFDSGPGRGRLSRLAGIGVVIGIAGFLAQIAVQAALATGDSLTAILDSSVWTPVLANNLGWAALALVSGLISTQASIATRNEVAAQTMSFYGLLAVALSLALWGHTSEATYAWLAIGLDTLHAFAVAVWFGGLLGIAVALAMRWRHRPTRQLVSTGGPTDIALSDHGSMKDESPSGEASAALLCRFSTAAAAALGGLTVSGIGLAWMEVGGWQALWSTDYGRTLLIKLVGVGAVLAAAGYNRFRLLPATSAAVDRSDAGATTLTLARVQRVVRGEVIALTIVLAITAVLVNTVPGGGSSGSGPFNQTVPFAGNLLNVGVSPAVAGANQMHITFLTQAGQPVAGASAVQVELTQPATGIGPISRAATPAGTGHFIVDTTDLSVSGIWQIEVIARISEFDQQRTSLQVPIGT